MKYKITTVSPNFIIDKAPKGEPVKGFKKLALGGETIEGNLNELAQVMCEVGITPGIFTGNEKHFIRRSEELKSIQFLCFDYDKGTNPQIVIEKLKKYEVNYIMVGSKNHMKYKNDEEFGGIIPRFHVLIPTDRAITTAEEYNEVLAAACEYFELEKIDESAKDCARFFAQHSCIIDVNTENTPADIDVLLKYYNPIKKQNKLTEIAKSKLVVLKKKTNTTNLTVEKWLTFTSVQEIISQLQTNGQRHKGSGRLGSSVKFFGGSLQTALNIFDVYHNGLPQNKKTDRKFVEYTYNKSEISTQNYNLGE